VIGVGQIPGKLISQRRRGKGWGAVRSTGGFIDDVEEEDTRIRVILEGFKGI
jgi:hypothetical protein